MATRIGLSRGDAERWWVPRSLVIRLSRNGHRYSSTNVAAGSNAPAQNCSGIKCPKTHTCTGGNSRNAPSIQATYQSATEGDSTLALLKSPHTQMGLICANPPARKQTAATRLISAKDRNA